MKGKTYNQDYPARISFKGEIKSSADEQNLREFSVTNQLFNKCSMIYLVRKQRKDL